MLQQQFVNNNSNRRVRLLLTLNEGEEARLGKNDGLFYLEEEENILLLPLKWITVSAFTTHKKWKRFFHHHKCNIFAPYLTFILPCNSLMNMLIGF